MTNDDSRLDELFRSYRASCPELEPSAEFMPGVWNRIEARRGFSYSFQQLARAAMAACAALCLLLLVLNLAVAPQSHVAAASYTDALLADHSAEKTYYTEAVRNTPTSAEEPKIVHH
jgi:hypothetical protein